MRKCFSVLTGEIFDIHDDEIKNISEEQILLKQMPSTSCKKCYGRLYIGKHMRMTPDGWEHDYFQPCPSCFKKCVDDSWLGSIHR